MPKDTDKPTKPKTLAEVREMLKKPLHKDPLSETEKIIAHEVAQKYSEKPQRR